MNEWQVKCLVVYAFQFKRLTATEATAMRE